MNYNPWTNNITHGNMKFVKIDGWKNNCHHAWYFIHLLGEFYHSGDIRMTVVETVEHFSVYLSGYEIYSLYVPDVIFWWVCFKYYFVILISIIGFDGCVNFSSKTMNDQICNFWLFIVSKRFVWRFITYPDFNRFLVVFYKAKVLIIQVLYSIY